MSRHWRRQEGMCQMARDEKRHDIKWAVINGGNALVHSVHRWRYEAEAERRAHACAYTVCRVIITPDYDGNYGRPA